VEFFDLDEDTNVYNKLNGGVILEPETIFWSFSGEIMVAGYENYLVIFKI
jgi:hypothetical protein